MTPSHHPLDQHARRLVNESGTAWHTLEPARLAEQLRTDLLHGLDPAEAARRLSECGPNELQAAHRISPWALLLEQFKNVLIVILLVAVGL